MTDRVVYVIGEVGPPEVGIEYVKVGVTRHVGYRLKELQTSNPRELQVLLTVGPLADAEKIETMVHRMLRPQLERGEWFRFTPEVVAMMELLGELEVVAAGS